MPRSITRCDCFAPASTISSVVHVTYTDHTAHELGIADPEYRKRFGRVDEMVARVAAAIPPGDTFVLLGDHGHDAAGRHALGLDVPTFALYRGPRERTGVDLARSRSAITVT